MRDENLHAVVARSTFWSQNDSKCTKHNIVGPLLEVAMSKKCTLLWREAHFEVKMYKTHQRRTTFWKLRCGKSARRCGAKHILKSKCTKHTIVGPLLEVEMLKKCTPLWREAHFEVKMYQTLHVRATFGGSDVEKVHAVVARSTKHHMFAPLLEVQMSLRFTTLHYITLHYAPLHYAPLHYTTLHNTTTTTAQHYNYNYTPLYSTTLNYTTLHYITLHSTTLHYITQHCTTFHYTSLHYTTLQLQLKLQLQLQLHNYTVYDHFAAVVKMSMMWIENKHAAKAKQWFCTSSMWKCIIVVSENYLFCLHCHHHRTSSSWSSWSSSHHHIITSSHHHIIIIIITIMIIIIMMIIIIITIIIIIIFTSSSWSSWSSSSSSSPKEV